MARIGQGSTTRIQGADGLKPTPTRAPSLADKAALVEARWGEWAMNRLDEFASDDLVERIVVMLALCDGAPSADIVIVGKPPDLSPMIELKRKDAGELKGQVQELARLLKDPQVVVHTVDPSALAGRQLKAKVAQVDDAWSRWARDRDPMHAQADLLAKV